MMSASRRPVALATGAGHRLGRAFAVGLARAGFDVAVHYRGSFEQAAETARLVNAEGGDAHTFQADLADAEAARGLVPRVLERFGRLDVLLHAASPWIEKPFLEMTAGDWDASFDAGPRAAFLLAQAAAGALGEREGSILLIGDVAAVKPWPHHVPHAVAKAAIHALVVNLAVALGPRVRVNGLAPGVVLPPDDLAPEAVARLVARTPIKRLVTVEDVVAGAIHLVTNRSVTGHVLFVDGGRAVV